MHSPERVGSCADCAVELVRPPNTPGRPAERCEECRYLRIRKQKALDSKKWRDANPDKYAEAIQRTREAARNTPILRQRRRLYSSYRLTPDQFLQMADDQDGLCAICRLDPNGRGKTNYLVVDHNHDSGAIRGLLCGKCNIALGLMDENPAALRAMAAYLKKWS